MRYKVRRFVNYKAALEGKGSPGPMRLVLARLSGVAAAVTLIVAAASLIPSPVRAEETTANEGAFDVAYLTNHASGHAVDLPKELSVRDVARYQQIFALQEDGHWKKADKLIAEIENDILMGHVLEQRYMHPNKYRSKYKELKDWMASYADHPQARRIYKLALKRRPTNWKYPDKPDLPKITYSSARKQQSLPYRKISKSKRREVRQLRRQIKRHAARGRTLAAKRLIQSDRVKKLFSEAQYDEVRGMLGFRYFIDGRDEWALQWAGDAADRSGYLVPDAHWAAGLAAYRLGKLEDSSRHFEALARADNTSDWLVSAGGFWAARTNMMNRNPVGVVPMLKLAADHPKTFYGILARHVLGWDRGLEWQAPPMQESALQSLTESRRGKRAVALVQVGQHQRAERELRYEAAAAAGTERAEGILALATHANMPGLSIRLDEMLFPEGGFDNAAYPVPSWTPDGGFTVDPALIFALIRQESRFNPKAKSWAGARGLMQLMPSTASFVENDRKYRASSYPYLFNPTLNMQIGQKYIEILRDDAKINGNLVAMVAAWNGGPGNVNKWRRTIEFQNDPLLFIEAIPSRETRGFVERVFANLWVYRDRLEQPAPSLDYLASGEWPVYTSVDDPQSQVAENER